MDRETLPGIIMTTWDFLQKRIRVAENTIIVNIRFLHLKRTTFRTSKIKLFKGYSAVDILFARKTKMKLCKGAKRCILGIVYKDAS